MDVVSNKKVIGTIILNLNDGGEKLLMHPIGEAIEFATARVSDEMTGLANMLQWFKEGVQLDVTSTNLVELTNAYVSKEDVPLSVFEVDEQTLKNEIDKDYTWVAPIELKTIWPEYHIKDVPMFQTEKKESVDNRADSLFFYVGRKRINRAISNT